MSCNSPLIFEESYGEIYRDGSCLYCFSPFYRKKTDKICPFFECGPARLYVDSFSRPIVPQGTTEVSC